ncbi:MAG: RiPP maturation radical SAM C-methyltransferase [Promethearchaeota archaeon]
MKPVTLVQPPFANIDSPSVGLSILKAILNRSNIETKIVYTNLLLAKKITVALYDDIALSMGVDLLGEWIFSSYAYPSASRKHKELEKNMKGRKILIPILGRSLIFEDVLEVKNTIGDYLEQCIDLILRENPKIVGFSTMFQQTCASIAMANKLKQTMPEIITVLGGANCSKPMGEALLEISPSIDYVFSGEADIEFVKFCSNILKNNIPKERFIDCSPIDNLNSLPYPDFFDYFEQRNQLGIDFEINQIRFESSRGCWWGERSQCLFCGLNACNIKYRQKTPERVRREIEYLVNTYQADHIQATDTILPKDFPSTVFETFEKPARLKSIYYEVRPNLSFKELYLLKSKGVTALQPGIESLNNNLLKAMKKGLTAENNIRFLRDFKTLGIRPDWNILYAIPGEKKEDYEDMIQLIPQITHLPPPLFLGPLNPQRYSPLFNEHEKYGIKNLRPERAYNSIFPDEADVENLALYFSGDFETIFKGKLKERFSSLLDNWLKLWKNKSPPIVHLVMIDRKNGFIQDTRPITSEDERVQVLGYSYFKILKKFREPMVESKVRTFIESNKLDSQFEELIDWKFILKIDSKWLSIVNEPIRVIELRESLSAKN